LKIINVKETERIIRNRQFRDTDNIVHTRHRTKSEKHSTSQKTKTDEPHRHHRKPWVNLGAREG